MKKTVSLVMAGLLALSLAGCADSKDQAANPGTTAQGAADQGAVGGDTAGGVTAAGGDKKQWPTGTMTIFVASQAGSNLDVKARLVAKYLGKELNETVIVENRPGAGGITAATQFLAEEPDANSIQYLAASHLAVAPIFNDVEYSADDFAVVAGLDTVENGFFVDASLGISTLEELQEYGKDKIVKFASTGLGNDSFLLSKVLMDSLGLKSDNINGDGFPDCILNVISQNADVCYCALNIAASYVEEGTLVPLAVYSEEDYDGYADFGYASVPSLKTEGYDITYSTITWFALRAGTDEANVKILGDALNRVYQNEEFQKELAAAGFVMMEDTSSAAVTGRVNEMVEECQSFADIISN